jgi:hypothetical protein
MRNYSQTFIIQINQGDESIIKKKIYPNNQLNFLKLDQLVKFISNKK